MTLTVKWFDGRREPKEKPNPDYPNGIDLDLRKTGQPFCQTSLPYPARRIGYYVIHCDLCDQKAAITTAGRRDDPRSVKLACKKPKSIQ